MRRLLLVCALGVGLTFAKGYEAGADRIDITPGVPIWQAGYASRTHPSTIVRQRLWAKALAIRDDRNNGVLIITTDLIGLPRAITDVVSARLEQNHAVPRSRILFNSSHTHTGPVVRSNLATMFELTGEDRTAVDQYARDLTDKLVLVAGAALSRLAPATLSYAEGEAGFAANRRTVAGPQDHTVPVLRVVSNASGKLVAVLAGYACHNTTLTGEFYEISGDYAGYAQAELERANPGLVAMFLMLCGGDQNPKPRSSLELAEQHGKELAQAVAAVVKGPMKPVAGRIHTAFEQTRLRFALHSREEFEAQLASRNPSEVRRARAMLRRYDEGDPVRDTPYPVQAISFGKSLTLLALGGEVVVDYSLRAKKEFGSNLIVAGYSNDVMCYIPSLRVLKEGGYEARDSMIYYGQPGPFAEDVEERVFDAIHRVMKRVGAKP